MAILYDTGDGLFIIVSKLDTACLAMMLRLTLTVDKVGVVIVPTVVLSNPMMAISLVIR